MKMFFSIVLFTMISAIGVSQESMRIMDPRDAKSYEIVEIGNQTWMAQNLSYDMLGSFVYEDKPSYEDIYGRLYVWEVATVVCPDGWHLPDASEWDELILFLGGALKAGKYLAQTESKKSGDSIAHMHEFNSIPSGNRDLSGSYNNLEQYAYYWTATEGDSIAARRIIIADKGASIGGGYGNKTSAYSVRCIKND